LKNKGNASDMAIKATQPPMVSMMVFFSLGKSTGTLACRHGFRHTKDHRATRNDSALGKTIIQNFVKGFSPFLFNLLQHK
jgi:hypothetical protein